MIRNFDEQIEQIEEIQLQINEIIVKTNSPSSQLLELDNS